MKKHSFTQKLTRFLNGSGFYIALACCFAVIGVSGWYLWQDLSTASRLAAEVGKSQTVVVEPQDTSPLPDEPAPAEESAEEPEDIPDESEEPMTDEEEDSAESEEAEETALSLPTEEAEETIRPTETAKPAETVMAEEPEPLHGWLWPLEGEVVSAFSSDTLTYNKAMGDWRTHSGIDLAAQLGQPVTAACGGTVISVQEDALLGKTVVMDCGGGLTLTYSNLAEEVAVTSGETLSAGDLIGEVGETAAGEVSDTPWLHFAVTQNGEAVDPVGFLQGRE